MDFRKALNNVVGKVDIRVKPPEHEVKRFKEGAGRRYVNVGISTRDFYKGVADSLKDKELKEYAKKIEKAIYTKDGELFETYDRLYKVRMQELGAWESVKGIGGFQKVKIMRKLGKLAKQQKEGDKGASK